MAVIVAGLACCLRFSSCFCPLLRVRALWPLPAWVWRYVRSLFVVFSPWPGSQQVGCIIYTSLYTVLYNIQYIHVNSLSANAPSSPTLHFLWHALTITPMPSQPPVPAPCAWAIVVLCPKTAKSTNLLRPSTCPDHNSYQCNCMYVCSGKCACHVTLVHDNFGQLRPQCRG